MRLIFTDAKDLVTHGINSPLNYDLTKQRWQAALSFATSVIFY
jgi:hypothetical protein